LFDGKVNLVAALRRLRFIIVFKSTGEKKLKINGNYYVKSVFDKLDFDFWCNSKTNDTVDVLKIF